MLNYNEVKEKKELFLAMTSLNENEFEKLLPIFEETYNTKYPNISNAGRKATLSLIEDKLFFILFYFKNYPLQEIIGHLFGMSQGQANEWIHRLSHVLEQTFVLSGDMPRNDGKDLGITSNSKKNFAIDGTERPIQRPVDNDIQKLYFSGKKKRHTVNDIIIVDIESRNIDFLSNSYVGSTHDKAICDNENIDYPKECTVYGDKGFEGYAPEGVNIITPKKKPRNRELSNNDKTNNSLISRIRIVVEHVISGIKRCHIIKQVFRNTKYDYDHLVMKVSCGLHNFRNKYRNKLCI